mmetsp:Transcript_28709/g.46230  ORF Transcript_28709/g.46230 Transcript_28709/m.46230 type:complete len:125 (+) Transcript_28709:600-974(+)
MLAATVAFISTPYPSDAQESDGRNGLDGKLPPKPAHEDATATLEANVEDKLEPRLTNCGALMLKGGVAMPDAAAKDHGVAGAGATICDLDAKLGLVALIGASTDKTGLHLPAVTDTLVSTPTTS